MEKSTPGLFAFPPFEIDPLEWIWDGEHVDSKGHPAEMPLLKRKDRDLQTV